MTLPRAHLVAGSLLVLGACASAGPAGSALAGELEVVPAFPSGDVAPQAVPLRVSPRAIEAWSASAASLSAEAVWADATPLLDAKPVGSPSWPLAAPLQGPGPRFKPHPSLATTRFLLGRQELDEDYWRPTHENYSIGLETAFERMDDWIGGEGGLFFTKDDGSRRYYDVPTFGEAQVATDIEMIELYLGVHRTFLRDFRLRPYIGAGGSALWVHGEQDIKPVTGNGDSSDNKELTFGLYAHAGVSIQITREFQIGVDYRVLGLTDVDVLTGSSGDVDYQLFSIFIGYGG